MLAGKVLLDLGLGVGGEVAHAALELAADLVDRPAGNCIKIGLPGKSILGDYFQEKRTSRRPLLLLRISFPARPIFIQLPQMW